uniref:Protein-lysine N-methyltransferase SMYD4 n=1 Tax=Anopheles christyi TaxID=43041 RepID=A0A182KF07_9DIPT
MGPDWDEMIDCMVNGEDKSNQFRTRGNAMFKGDRWTRPAENHLVLEAYSKAIFAAPGGSRALALGHANRAVVLIRLRYYREAFDDCQLALDGDYPEESRLKVLFRQAECAESMGEAYKLAPIIDGIAQIAAKKELTKAELQRLEALRLMYEAADRCTVEDENAADHMPNQAALKEKKAPSVGRYVVAAEIIQANDIIARETAVSFVPVYDPESRSTLPSFDCQKCAKVNVVPFPCDTCGRACYCSILCRKAHQPVHQLECFGYRKHLWFRIGIAHLGLRCLLDGFGTISEEIATAKDATVCYERLMEATREEPNPFSHYGRVLRLVTNFEKMERNDRLRYALAGLMLTIYLHECTPFAAGVKRNSVMSPSELLVCCGALITRHIGQLVCNGHAISELRATGLSNDCFDVNTSLVHAGSLNLYFKSSRVFTAIFPRISMFNHSCDPNIRNHFNRSTLTVHATRQICAGGEIFNCYGPHHRLMSAKERQMLLRGQYCFNCTCERCREDDTAFKRFNMIRCPACRREYSKELDAEELHAHKPTFCVYCYEEIPTEWYRYIFSQLDATDPNNFDGERSFQCVEREYDIGSRILINFNQTRGIALRHILHHYTKFASLNPYLCCSLSKLALEYALLMRERFDYMSLEFLTGCFYLLDVWATFCLCGDGEHHELEQEVERTVLKQFCEALDMIGEDNRALILEFMKRFNIINEEEPKNNETLRRTIWHVFRFQVEVQSALGAKRPIAHVTPKSTVMRRNVLFDRCLRTHAFTNRTLLLLMASHVRI